MHSRLAAYDPQFEIFEGDRAPSTQPRNELLSEIHELELATELMELRDERSLRRFVGRVVAATARATGRGRGAPAAEPIQRLLMSILQRAIPRSPPGSGSAANLVAPVLGDRLADIPDHRLGLELEGLSEEDRQFETARQLVRFAVDAGRRALAPSQTDPGSHARAAVFAAARRHAPGLVANWQPVTAARFGSGFENRAGPGPP